MSKRKGIQWKGKDDAWAYLYVRGSEGGNKLRAAGTRDQQVAAKIKRLVERLREDPKWWPLLDAVCKKKLKLSELYRAHVDNALDALHGRLNAVDLAPLVEPWLSHYEACGGSAVNVPVYRQRVKAFVGESCLTSDLSHGRVQEWLDDLIVSSGTRRAYLMALKSFVRYCVDRGHLPANPLRDVRPPRKNRARLEWRTLEVDQQIVEAAPSAELRALFALVHATGADLSATLTHTLCGDFDLPRGRVRLRGTKSAKRDRAEVLIDEWALPYLQDYLDLMLPTVRPWAHLTRFQAAWHHKKACERCGISNYSLRDARHSCAVRWRHADRSFEWIAAQLGNSVYQVATVYARFSPTLQERCEEAMRNPVRNAVKVRLA